jgi:hypothetical protein
LFDTFSIKHIPWEENSRANQLPQQASGYVVSQGVFWVASVSLVEHRYVLKSKGKPVLENSDQLQDEENQFRITRIVYQEKQGRIQVKQSRNREKQNQNMVVKLGYGKK